MKQERTRRFTRPGVRWLAGVLLLTAMAGCVHVKVDPIYAKIDVTLKIDRSLDEFYNFQKPAGAATIPAVLVPVPTTLPASTSEAR